MNTNVPTGMQHGAMLPNPQAVSSTIARDVPFNDVPPMSQQSHDAVNDRSTPARPIGADLLPPITRQPFRWQAYVAAIAVTGIATLAAFVLQRLGLSDASLIMTYLAAVVYVAAKLGRGPAIAASVISISQYNFFFTPPYFTFIVYDTSSVYDFLVMFLVAMVISTLTTRIRAHANTEALYRLSRRLADASGAQTIAALAEEELCSILSGEVAIFLPDNDELSPIPHSGNTLFDDAREHRAATWSLSRRTPAGAGTDTLVDATAMYLPLVHSQRALGVLAWKPEHREDLLNVERRRLLGSIAHHIALVLERDRLARETQRVLAQIEAEQLRSSLLSSVSHDLRTPLAAIAGSASTLLNDGMAVSETERELLVNIHDEADRLARLVENLLSMTRIQAGAMALKKEPQPLDEVVATAIRRVAKNLKGRDLTTAVQPDLPLVPVDGLLIEQVLINLLENATKYSPADAPIRIAATMRRNELVVSVSDKGSGLEPQEREQVFEKFYRSASGQSDRGRGAGLGLTICRAIINAHGGRIWADANAGGGSVFSFTLPLVDDAPQGTLAVT